MFIEFCVANYPSILERQTLNMAASPYFKELDSLNTFVPNEDDSVPRLLRSTVLYGPQCLGEKHADSSTAIYEKASAYFPESQAGDEIDVVPFKLTAASRAADSEFEVTFLEQGGSL